MAGYMSFVKAIRVSRRFRDVRKNVKLDRAGNSASLINTLSVRMFSSLFYRNNASEMYSIRFRMQKVYPFMSWKKVFYSAFISQL